METIEIKKATQKKLNTIAKSQGLKPDEMLEQIVDTYEELLLVAELVQKELAKEIFDL